MGAKVGIRSLQFTSEENKFSKGLILDFYDKNSLFYFRKGKSPAFIYPCGIYHFLWLPPSKDGKIIQNGRYVTEYKIILDDLEHHIVSNFEFKSFKKSKEIGKDNMKHMETIVKIYGNIKVEDALYKFDSSIKTSSIIPEVLEEKHLQKLLPKSKKEYMFKNETELSVYDGDKIIYKENIKMLSITDHITKLFENVYFLDHFLSKEDKIIKNNINIHRYLKYISVERTIKNKLIAFIISPLYRLTNSEIIIYERALGNWPYQIFDKFYITENPFIVEERIIGKPLEWHSETKEFYILAKDINKQLSTIKSEMKDFCLEVILNTL